MSKQQPVEMTEARVAVIIKTVKYTAEKRFKECVDSIDTNSDELTDSRIESYKKFQAGLHCMKEIDPQWNIEVASRSSKFQIQLFENLFSDCLDQFSTSNLGILKLGDCYIVHKTLKSIRAIDPEWSINGSKRTITMR
jgi:hypothetical protein